MCLGSIQRPGSRVMRVMRVGKTEGAEEYGHLVTNSGSGRGRRVLGRSPCKGTVAVNEALPELCTCRGWTYLLALPLAEALSPENVMRHPGARNDPHTLPQAVGFTLSMVQSISDSAKGLSAPRTSCKPISICDSVFL